jgi:hypothetical protein
MARIFVGTEDGLHEFDAGGRAGNVEFGGREVTALAPEGWNFWAIIDGREIWHTAGEPWWFHVATLEELQGNCVADTRAGVIVGASEAHLYRVAGEGLEPVAGFDEIEGRSEWFTPWGGPPDSRSISEDDQAVFVNVHVGGIARSRDQGTTWEPTIDIQADVHKVWASDGRVLAACARGLAVSEDRGDRWAMRTEGLQAPYCRGVAVCGESVLVSASNGPRGGRSALYRGTLDGPSFERCREGLPEWFDDNIDSYWLDAIPSGELAAFGTSDGTLFASTNQGAGWAEVASGLPPIRRVLVVS